jgi:AraC-like DNA-binding protein
VFFEKPVLDFELKAVIAEFAKETVARYLPLVIFRRAHEGTWPSRGRFLDFQSLVICDCGRGVHIVNSTPHVISRGDVCVIGVGSDQTLTDTDGLVLYEIHFKREIFDARTWAALREMPGFGLLVVGTVDSHRLHLDPDTYAEIEQDLIELWTEWCTASRANAALVRALFLRLLVRIARVATAQDVQLSQRPSRRRDGEEIIAAALRKIDMHHGAGITVCDLATSAHVSRRHFTHLFTSIMGQRPSEYIRHLRLKRAKTLLVKTDMPIEEIARAAGFADHPHLSRTIRLDSGMTPREFRNQRRPQRAPTQHW